MRDLKGSLVLLLCITFTKGFYQEDSPSNSPNNEFSIGAAFTRSTSAPAVAAKMAIEDIRALMRKNSHRESVNVSIVETGDSECDTKSSASLIYKLMSSGAPKPVIMAGCPHDCEMMGRASPVWNTMTVCYGMSKEFTHGHEHLPSLFLAQPNPFAANPSLVKFIRHFHWNRVAVLYEDYENLYDIAHQLSFSLEEHSVSVEVFRVEISPAEESLTLAMDLIKSQDIRIILTLASSVTSREILCQIYHRQLFGPEKYVWFFLGLSRNEWFLQSNLEFAASTNTNGSEEEENLHSSGNIRQFDCTAVNLIDAADGHFQAQAVVWNPNEQIETVSGMRVRDFKNKMLQRLRQNGEHIQSDFDEAPLAYDAVWAVYLVVNKTLSDCKQEEPKLSSCNFEYDNYELGERFRKMLAERLWFQGVSGEVSFTEEGKRSISNACIKIQRYKKNKMNTIAWHFNFNNSMYFIENPFITSIPSNGSSLLPDKSSPEKCNSANRFMVSYCNLLSFLFPLCYILFLTVNLFH